MSRTYRRRNSKGGGRRSERRLRVVGVRRDPPDVGKLSRAVLAMAMQRAEAEAKAASEVERTEVEGHTSAPGPDRSGEVADDR